MDWFTLLLIFIFFVLPLIQQIAEARKRGGQPPVDAPEEEWDWEAEQREAQRSGTAEAQREQVSGNGGWSEGWGSWPGDPPPEPVAEERPVDRAERVTVPRREPDTVSERPSGEHERALPEPTVPIRVERPVPEIRPERVLFERAVPVEPVHVERRETRRPRERRALSRPAEGAVRSVSAMAAVLHDRNQLRRALVLSEILGPPRSLRELESERE
jgi:hypothetical protein